MRAMSIQTGIGLFDQDAVGRPVPSAAPGLVSPAEAGGEVGLLRAQHVVERPFQYAASGAPVMIIAEALYASGPRQRCLRLTRFGKP